MNTLRVMTVTERANESVPEGDTLVYGYDCYEDSYNWRFDRRNGREYATVAGTSRVRPIGIEAARIQKEAEKAFARSSVEGDSAPDEYDRIYAQFDGPPA